ncbi:hypothetical protein IGK74_000556 [Enterococcus sp. AZ150]|uniref:hypothetical protein n=1 Tax=Enterococcus sp. AZ150 TaxID=2774866 RepID=UPI003F2091F1
MARIESLDFANEFTSLDRYNFLLWSAPIVFAQDIVKSVIPDYKTADDETVHLVYKAVTMAISKLKEADRINITPREYAELKIMQEQKARKEQDFQNILAEYCDINVSNVLMANVLTTYGNAGNNRSDGYLIAKKWCIEQGVFSDIEHRALNELNGRSYDQVEGKIHE